MFLLKLIQLIRSIIGSQGQKGDGTMFRIGNLTRLYLGYVGENESRVISIDMNEWLEKWPDATIVVQVVRPDGYKYFAATEMENGVMTWEVTAGEVLYKGKGFAQITAVDLNTDKEYKSRTVETIIAESLEEFNSLVLAETDPAQKWVNKVLEAAKQAEDAVDKMPYIGENGNWMIWDAETGAFKDSGEKAAGPAGSYNLVDGTADGSVRQVLAAEESDDYNLGRGSIAVGVNAQASGANAAAFGFKANASGINSIAMGGSTTASGTSAAALGLNTTAAGRYSLAQNSGTVANADRSTAMGNHTTADGEDQLVIGRRNLPDTEGKYAFIVGGGPGGMTADEGTEANAATIDWDGNMEIAGSMSVMGPDNQVRKVLTNLVDGPAVLSVKSIRALDDGEELTDGDVYTQGSGSMALGMACAAPGQLALAFGAANEAIGQMSVALGYNTQAKGDAAIALGTATIAGGDSSLTAGTGTEANGADSVALGAYTVVNGDQQAVVGRQNEWDEEGKYAFIVGNGSADTVGPAHRSNAFTVDWEGNAHASGKVTGSNMDMGESGIYIVTVKWSDEAGSFVADRSKSEIVAAAAAGKTCLLHLDGMDTDFLHAGNGLFVRAEYDIVNRSNGGTYFCWVTVDEDKKATWQDVGPYANILNEVDDSTGPYLLINYGGGWIPVSLTEIKSILGIA